MLIGEIAKRTGLTRDTIRFYEKEALIEPLKRGRNEFRTNTYKDYPESVVSTLHFIQRTKVLGFTLAEIQDLLALREPGQKPSKKWAGKAQEKLAIVDAKIRELSELKSLLAEAMIRCSDQCFDVGCGVLDDAVAKGNGVKPAQGKPCCG